jgi:hypothetical protein
MFAVLEAEIKRDYAIGHVLKKVESAEAMGRDRDLESARLTTEAFENAKECWVAISNHFDIDTLLTFVKDMGLTPQDIKPSEVQVTFGGEYHRAKEMFKGLEHAETKDALWPDELFPTELLHEGPLQMAKIEDGKKRANVWVAVYEDKIAWWTKKERKMKGKHSSGHYMMRDLLQAVNTKHHNFRLTHFDEPKSVFFFTSNQVETERWIDKISHAIIDYNRIEVGDVEVEYEAKHATIVAGVEGIAESLRKGKKPMKMHWKLIMEWLDRYVEDLFQRLMQTRREGNEQRTYITKNNPHMAKRRVAADLDRVVEKLAMVKAAIKIVPLVDEYARDLRQKADGARRILDHSTQENMVKMHNIYTMLDTEHPGDFLGLEAADAEDVVVDDEDDDED